MIFLKQDSIHREYKDSYLNLLFIIPLSHHGWILPDKCTYYLFKLYLFVLKHFFAIVEVINMTE